MSRLFLVLPLLLTLIFSPAFADDDDDERRSKPVINQVQINGSSIFVYGNELIKNRKDKVFFAAESSSEMIEVPFMEDGNNFLEVMLPYVPSTGTYRLGIGKSQKKLRVSELLNVSSASVNEGKFIANCTNDADAFNLTLQELGAPTAGFIEIQILGDCEVDSSLRFDARKIYISGADDNGECVGGLVNRDSSIVTINAFNSAFISLQCLKLDYARDLTLRSVSNSRLSLFNVTGPPVKLAISKNSSLQIIDSTAPPKFIVTDRGSELTLINVEISADAFVSAERDSHITIIGGGAGPIEFVRLYNGSSVDLQTLQIGAERFLPPAINIASLKFGSRLKTDNAIAILYREDFSRVIQEGDLRSE